MHPRRSFCTAAWDTQCGSCLLFSSVVVSFAKNDLHTSPHDKSCPATDKSKRICGTPCIESTHCCTMTSLLSKMKRKTPSATLPRLRNVFPSLFVSHHLLRFPHISFRDEGFLISCPSPRPRLQRQSLDVWPAGRWAQCEITFRAWSLTLHRFLDLVSGRKSFFFVFSSRLRP